MVEFAVSFLANPFLQVLGNIYNAFLPPFQCFIFYRVDSFEFAEVLNLDHFFLSVSFLFLYPTCNTFDGLFQHAFLLFFARYSIGSSPYFLIRFFFSALLF